MNLYLVNRSDNVGYDNYDQCVVAAVSEDAARLIHPSGMVFDGNNASGSWVKLKGTHKLRVELIGTTHLQQGLVLSSFLAG